MDPQPFFTSKGFWTSFLGAGVLIFHMAQTHIWDPTLVSAAVLAILSNVFRWTADQPLSLSGGTQRGAPRHGIDRLTKD